MEQNQDQTPPSTISNNFVPNENAVALSKLLAAAIHRKYGKDWSVPNYRGDGYDNDRIKKARDKRERRAARNLKNQTGLV